MENGILLPTLQSALPFLDLHGTPRLEFHQSVFDELRENLMERVAVIAEGKEADRWVAMDSEFRQKQTLLTLGLNRYSKLEELLEKSFPLVKMPSIQPVVMQVLKHLPKVSACPASSTWKKKAVKSQTLMIDYRKALKYWSVVGFVFRYVQKKRRASFPASCCRSQRRSWRSWWLTRSCTKCVLWRWKGRSGRTTRPCLGTKCPPCLNSTSWRRKQRSSAATSLSCTASSARLQRRGVRGRWARLSRSPPAWRLHLWNDAAAVAGGPEADPDDWEEREALRHGAAVFKDAVPANAERALLHSEGGAAHVSSRSGHHWDLLCGPLP